MKHSKFLTIAVASVMAFSAFALASCGDDDDDNNTPSGSTTGTAVVTNEALTGKLISYYSFENGGAATDPMTGASVSDYDVTLSTEDTVSGKTGNGIQSGSTYVTLPLFNDAITLEGGVSFSFVSYSDVSITNDWNDLVTTDYMEITYGNLDGVVSAYPAICSELGVGAYAASAYAEAQDVLTTAQLASPTGNAYYGYNAGLVEGSDDGTYVGALFAEMVSTWQYFTITVTTEDVCFYRNGALAYRYGSEIIGNKGDYLLRDVIDLDEGMDTNLTKLFAGEGGIIDDLIVGSALTADEVLALYNDLSGSSKTTADVTVKSNLNEDEANKATADAEVVAAVKAQRKETTATARDELLASVLNQGVDQVGTVGSGNDLSVNAWYTTKYASASDMYKPTVNDDGTFTVVLEYYQFSDQAANYHSASTILYNNSAEALALRQDAYGRDVNEEWYA